ncbi:MAG: hypothetical protein M1378_07720 [Bacteroidetes bacterium]|nr:hypothetical protein [Bacteroidota bacterium]
MGQQQLLLIVLGVIIVGIAIAVGISMFKSNAQSSNRDQVINDLNNLAAKAQQYYRKPTSMAGGGQSFAGFWLAPVDTGNANGSYTTKMQSGPYTAGTYATFVHSTGAPADSITGGSAAQTMYIVGLGTEVGNDGTNKVEAVTTVTQNGATTIVLN